MKNVHDIIDTIGADAIQEALNVSEFALKKAKQQKKFTASWYDVMERLCLDANVDCPRSLFTFKVIEGAK